MSDKIDKTYSLGNVRVARSATEIKTADGPRIIRSVAVSRSYKDQDGNFEYTNWLNASDLGAARTLLSQAEQDLLTVRENGSEVTDANTSD